MSRCPSEYHEEDDRKPEPKRIKKEPEDEAQSWSQEEMTEKPTPMPWEDKKYYQAIFSKSISIGEDGKEHYDVIDMQIETFIMHAISGKDGDGIQVTIPLSLRCVTSYFWTRKTSKEEFNSCPQFDLTYEACISDPHSEIFKQQEEALLDKQGVLQEWEHDESSIPQMFILAFDSYLLTSYIHCLDDSTHNLSIVLEDEVNTISSISIKK